MKIKVSVSAHGDLTVLDGCVTCSVGWRWMRTIEVSQCVWKLICESCNGNFSGFFECSGFFRMKMTNYILYTSSFWPPICCCLQKTYKQQLSDFTTSAFICPGRQVTSLANVTCCSGITLLTDLSRAERSGKSRISRMTTTMLAQQTTHLAHILFSPNRVAWIINLYINFPADRKRHVDMSSVSHGDWSWLRWDGRGRKPHSLADDAIPVNSHILFSLPGSERVSFPSLAQEGVWHGNRIRSEVTRCYLPGIVYQQTFWQLEQLTGSLWWSEVTARLLFQPTVWTIIISIEKSYVVLDSGMKMTSTCLIRCFF